MARLGFGCLWEPDPSTTWSGTPFALYRALREHTDVVDLGPHLGRATRATLRALYARRSGGRWHSPWRYGRVRDVVVERHLRRAAARHGVEAVVEVHDLAAVGPPYWLVQDLSYDILLDLRTTGLVDLQFPGMSDRWLERRRLRQRAIYAGAHGLFPMSEWFAQQLVALSDVAPERITVVRPGTNIAPRTTVPRAVSEGPPRLLFVGRDFERKGGHQVLDAFARLRRTYDPAITLTICGPASWPRSTPPDEGIAFRGPCGADEVSRLYDEHDLFVLPSRFEAFGIVFLEALAHGVPCIARDAFAMPELVRPGVNGALVRSDDPDELADQIVAVLDDRALRQAVADGRADAARDASWDRAAAQVVEAVGRVLG